MIMWRYWKCLCLKISSFLVFVFLFQIAFGQNIEQSAVDLLLKIDSSLQKTDGLMFKAEIYARLKGNDYNQKADFKIQRKPLKIYYRQYLGNNIELLYDETKNKEKALVNPDGFPFANLNLSPYSSLILKRQHHNVFEADPLYTLEQILKMVEDCKTNECVIKLSDTILNHRKLKVFWYENLNYEITEIRPKEDIDLLDLAKKLGLNFYSIASLNKGFDSDTEIDEGETVRIPSSYAKEIVLFIDQDQIFEVQVYDKKGLFEKMKYIWFKKDVQFKSLDFSKENPDYNF